MQEQEALSNPVCIDFLTSCVVITILTVTDLSYDFFAQPKKQFAAHEAISYNILDVLKGPIELGFKEPNELMT